MICKLVFSISFSLFAFLATAQNGSRDTYIERFRNIAISEAERAGVPASIKLAQGILESNAGQSTLARKANNHFGMKCHNDWKGKKHYREDDDYDENGKLIKSCFRVYKNADASYIAHSEFLRDPKKRYRYGYLFTLPPTDYRAWAQGLKDAGYATSPTYATKLISIIESYELFRYDNMSIADVQHGNAPDLAGLNISRINDIKVIFSETGETPADIARRTGVSTSRILKYNEKLTSANQTIKANTRVFLQPKRNNFRGKKKWHYVKEGETMFYISQIYGLKLSKLYKKNRIKKDTEPAIGERMKIRGWCKVNKKKAPKTGERPELEEEPETPIEIEIPVDPEDDEDFGEGIEPEIPDTEFIDEEIETEEKPPFIEDTSETDTTEPDITNPETDMPPATGVYYIVLKGDTLFSISRRYGTTIESIKVLNNLTSDTIGIGQRLRIF